MARAFLWRRIGGLWDWHMSPFTVLRSMGYYGANKMLNGYVRRRLNLDSEAEKEAFKELLLQCNMRDISSEICITILLEFGAWARIPMKD